jgi:mono/diheme cytochrome c family protein
MKQPVLIITLSMLLGYALPQFVQADTSQIGETEFRNHCAGCHGLDGKGNGPFVEFLKMKPGTLTTLARENQGVFPFRNVYEIINGTRQVDSHGASDMPVWGERYATEIVRQYGEFGSEHPQTVRCRILELVFYLATIQEP